MAKDDPVDVAEDVVRAGMYPYWEPALKRATPAAFTSEEVSISRLAILDLASIIAIFQSDFDQRTHPDGESMAIRGVGCANVGDILRQVDEPIDAKKGTLPPVVLKVVEDPIENEVGSANNLSHALIRGLDRENPAQPKKITRGVANRLLSIFKWEEV